MVMFIMAVAIAPSNMVDIRSRIENGLFLFTLFIFIVEIKIPFNAPLEITNY